MIFFTMTFHSEMVGSEKVSNKEKKHANTETQKQSKTQI